MKLNPELGPFVFGAGLFAAIFVLGAAQAEVKEKSPTAKVRHTDAPAAAKLVATNAVVILDIRTPAEFNAGHIAGATNIDFRATEFTERLAQLDRGKTYLVHCASGRRSTNSLPQLERLGFTNLIHLDGGFRAWQAAGNPVVKP